MKTKTITLYEFSELSETAKKKAIEKLRDCNVGFDWWQFIYDDFNTIVNLIGIELKNKARKAGDFEPEIYFNISCSQSDGSSFNASIDVFKLIAAIENEAWREHAPNENFNFPAVTPRIKRAAKLLKSGKIDFTVWIETANRESSIRVMHEYCQIDANYISQDLSNIANLFEQDVYAFVELVAKRLNQFLFAQLGKELEYRTSDEAIIETIEANSWTFTENGKLENA